MAGVPSHYYYNPQPEDRELTYRSAMLPLGTYRNDDGTESPGLAWPGMITEPINALERLGSGGFSNPQDPASQQDMTTLLLSLYGGNALNPLARVPKGAIASGAMRETKPKGITAYHGSPHEFDKFSTEHIGKGEGAQAFGHGLYFAESEGVARSYRDRLKTPGGSGTLYDAASNFWSKNGGSREDAAVAAASRKRELAPNGKAPKDDAKYREWSSLASIERVLRDQRVPDQSIGPGHLYQVRINAEPEDFLDWDKPLSQHSEKVRAILSQGDAGKQVTKSLSDQLDDLKSGKSIFKATPERIAEFSRGIETLTGEQIMKRLPFGEGSKALSDAGIAGIRYLDQGSRSKGEGSYNYVIFDDSLIEITHKNGVPVQKASPVNDLARQAQEAASAPDPVSAVQSIIARAASGDIDQEALTGIAQRIVSDIASGQNPQEVIAREIAPYLTRPSEPLYAMRSPDQDSLGYYSGLLRSARNLRQERGTPEQMLAMLKKEGGKDAELEATGLRKFLEERSVSSAGTGDAKSGAVTETPSNGDRSGGQAGAGVRLKPTSITKSEIISYLESNGVGLRESRYGGDISIAHDAIAPAKWSPYSLDPTNQTYRETVLHLPERDTSKAKQELDARYEAGDVSTPEYRAELDRIDQGRIDSTFRSGHFPEPNIVGHMMTSVVKHEGKDTLLLDQIQSDWGQKLRDGGVRDEAKIAELTAKHDNVRAELDALVNGFMARAPDGDRIKTSFGDAQDRLSQLSAKGDPEGLRFRELFGRANLLRAELRTAEAATPGHPLVNTTDQWTNTVLRRAIRQAAEQDADYIAIPHGDTVLSYNPGDMEGMRGFYGSRTQEGIVPKNLRKLLEKLDKETPPPQRVEKLETPNGLKGWNTDEVKSAYPSDAKQTGFTVFPLTDKVKATVVEQGQPLYAMRTPEGRMKPGANGRAQDLDSDLKDIENALKGASIDDREALQRKRAALLNAKAGEVLADDVDSYRDARGRMNRAEGLMRSVEAFARGKGFRGMDAASQATIIKNKVEQIMAEPLWYFRKGAITGDRRRQGKLVGNQAVITTMKDMFREAAGENTGNALAKTFAKSYMEAMEYLRQRRNAAGGGVLKMKGWFAPQFHNREAMLRAGRDEWVDFIGAEGILDLDRMEVTQKELKEILRDAFSTITTDGMNQAEPAAYRGKGALYKRGTDHRILHFKNADAFFKYADAFGSRDLYAMMWGHIEREAKEIAAMERFGANPEYVIQREMSRQRNLAANERTAKSIFDDLQEQVDDIKTTLAGSHGPVDAAMAKVADVHQRLEALRGKQRKGKAREELRQELWAAHSDLRDALTHKGMTPEQTEMLQEIVRLSDEMTDIKGKYSVFDRDPVSSTNRILKRADEMWKAYIGTTNTPVDNRWATIMAGTRNWAGASILPAASISSLADEVLIYGARKFIGMPTTGQLIDFVKALTKSDRKAALDLMLGLDQVQASYIEQARFVGAINARSLTGYLVDRTHALSGLSPMTQARKTAWAFRYVTWMADLANQFSFDKLPQNSYDMLIRHGWTEADWKLLRTVTPDSRQGRPILTFEAIARDAGDELAEKYMRTMLRERRHGILEPSYQGRTAFISDMQSGSVPGELARSAAMLKSFPLEYMMQVMGRIHDEWVGGNKARGIQYATTVVVLGMAMGAIIRQLKNVVYLRDPENMDPIENPTFWYRSFMQSGGFGIYGDLIGSSVNRFGGGLADTLMGPVWDSANNLANLTIGNVIQYAQDEPTNFGREATRFIRKNTPVLPFYLRGAYDRLFIDEIQKKVDPGFHRSVRMKIQAQKKLSGNDYYWPPGSPRPLRGPDFGSAFGSRP